jgi:hypothetical protein
LNNLNNIHPTLKEEYFNRIKVELQSLNFENNPYLDKSIIEDAKFVKNGSYSSSKYFVLLDDADINSKQPPATDLIKNLISKFERIKKKLLH